MQKTVSAVFSITLSILLASLFLASSSYAQVPINQEQSIMTQDVSVEKADATMSASPERINYELAYPGMLPDNPLYFLKMVRDKIVKILITEPLAKAKFNVLNAEKRMYASQFLVDKKKYELAAVTASKSNNYFHEAITEIKKENRNEVDTIPFVEQMKTVINKHQEVLSNLIKTTNGPSNTEAGKAKSAFQSELKRAEVLENSVNELLLEKNRK